MSGNGGIIDIITWAVNSLLTYFNFDGSWKKIWELHMTDGFCQK